MNSCLYVGSVRHRRFAPRAHSFRYSLFMVFIDLDELPTLFDRFWCWSSRRPALAWFRRADFYGNPERPLADCVRDLIHERSGARPAGPIRLLTHLRYFGHNFNPVSFYYVYGESGDLQYIVAEITNTPWKERHAYVLAVTSAQCVTAGSTTSLRWQFDKQFHVSPFLPMDMRYDWRLTEPRNALNVHMQTHHNESLQLDATLTLHREPISHFTLLRALLSFPLLTVKVTTLIYWQALKLYLRRTPAFDHPEGLVR